MGQAYSISATPKNYNDIIITCKDVSGKDLASATVTISENVKEDMLSELLRKEMDYFGMLKGTEVTLDDFTTNKNSYQLKPLEEDSPMDEFEHEALQSLLTDLQETRKNQEQYKNGILIYHISAPEPGTAAGTFIVDYLKKTYNYIALYSLTESIDYWEKQNFTEFDDGFMVYPESLASNQHHTAA